MKKIPRKEKPVIIEQENPVYFKLGYDESINSKKDLLFSELSFLTILKIMKRYNLLRTEELKIKSEMYKIMRELDVSMQKTKSVFPFLKIPERARRKEIIKIEPTEGIKSPEETFDENLEAQLRNIQARLNSIGR